MPSCWNSGSGVFLLYFIKRVFFYILSSKYFVYILYELEIIYLIAIDSIFVNDNSDFIISEFKIVNIKNSFKLSFSNQSFSEIIIIDEEFLDPQLFHKTLCSQLLFYLFNLFQRSQLPTHEKSVQQIEIRNILYDLVLLNSL